MRPGGAAVAAALTVLLLGSGVSWAVASYDAGRRHTAANASATAALSTLDRRAQAVVSIVAGPPEELSVLKPAEVRAVLNVAGMPSGPVRILSGQVPAGVAPASLVTSARTAMEVARDTGTPQAAPGAGGLLPVVVPVLPRGAAPTSTAERRARITSWHVALLSPRDIVAGLPPTAPRAVALRVDGATYGNARGGTVAGTILVAGEPWTLVMAPAKAPLSRGALATLAMTLLGALACLGAELRTQQALRRERAANAARERESRTVAEVGPLLQSSLDLAEVLPAVGLRLVDEFGLSRISVQLVGEQGHLLDVFAIGARANGQHNEVDVSNGAVRELPAATPGALPLLRAGRTIGRMTFAGHQPLGHAQLAALSAAADLIAVATYNVELFEREQASVRRLRELDQLKDAFLGTISHELRTPLTAISGFIRLLRDRWDQLRDEQRKEFLDRVHGNTLSLGLLVDDLLDFARLERQALNAPADAMDLDAQVERMLAQLAPVLGDRQVTARVEPVRAMANAGALERVLANLLTNAAKFSPPDSSIVVTVGRDDGMAMVEVADQGAGIAPEDRERIFTRFYRGDSDAARGTRGAGIGLSVVRELLHQMGGTVTALPNSPRGTRMVIRLPLEDQPVTPELGPHVHAQRSAP